MIKSVQKPGRKSLNFIRALIFEQKKLKLFYKTEQKLSSKFFLICDKLTSSGNVFFFDTIAGISSHGIDGVFEEHAF